LIVKSISKFQQKLERALLSECRRLGEFGEEYCTVWQEGCSCSSIDIYLHEEIYKMKFTMTKIAAGLVLVAASMSAQAVVVQSASVTGGTFEMPGFTFSPLSFVAYGTGAADLIGYNNGSGGSNVSNTAFDPAGIVGFNFGAPVQGVYKTVNTYTANSNMGDAGSAAGTIPGGPAVTASAASFTNGAAISFDLRSFFANYNGTDFNQGSGKDAVGNLDGSFATGTLSNCSGNTCDYSIGWSSYIVGGPFDGNTGVWTMTGTAVAAVPEASTYGMMLAGLGLVGGMVARRRKLMA
jgi:hypothetical protein